MPLRRSNPSELSTGFPWEDSPWHLHSIIQLLALESNQPDSCHPHPRLSSLGKSDSQNCPSSFKGEIAKADFQLFLILDPPKTLVKIVYIDNYEQICTQYPPNLQDLCKLLLITTSCWHFNYFTSMQISGILPQIAIHHLKAKNNSCTVRFWSNVKIQQNSEGDLILLESDKILNNPKLLSFAEMRTLNLLIL